MTDITGGLSHLSQPTLVLICQELVDRNRELQAAVDRAHGAIQGTAYVGGPSEAEAYHIVVGALGPLATQHTGVEAPLDETELTDG